MDYSFSDLVHQTRQWVDTAIVAGWLSDQDKEKVSVIEVGDPAALFSESTKRPLVVAFFGGTGVGKSSLLNRLAGQDIARVGIERPTSREVSAFVHNSVQIARLPADFPTEKIKIAHHGDNLNKDILWIDMPDIDSIEQANRQIVLQWLPHIDVIIYVVSPERYRDDNGWRLLFSHGHNHAWLFVMNHWDQGQDVQFEALKKQIEKAGFENPIVLRTDCRNNTGDDFDELGLIIGSLAKAKTINQLEQRGLMIRLEGLNRVIEQCINTLGPDHAQKKLETEWAIDWGKTKQTVGEGLDWSVQQIAKNYSTQGMKLLRPKKEQELKGSTFEPQISQSVLWDDWAQSRLDDTLGELLIKSDALAIPVKPLKSRLQSLSEKALPIIQGQAEQSLREALANPGNRLQRFFLNVAKVTAVFLPLTAISWVAYRLFTSYYQSGISGTEYLGMNFAIHSFLLVVTAWLLPWFLHRKLKPSMERVAIKGLRNGLNLGLDCFANQVNQKIEAIWKDRLGLAETGRHLANQCRNLMAPTDKIEEDILKRVLKRV